MPVGQSSKDLFHPPKLVVRRKFRERVFCSTSNFLLFVFQPKNAKKCQKNTIDQILFVMHNPIKNKNYAKCVFSGEVCRRQQASVSTTVVEIKLTVTLQHLQNHFLSITSLSKKGSVFCPQWVTLFPSNILLPYLQLAIE